MEVNQSQRGLIGDKMSSIREKEDSFIPDKEEDGKGTPHQSSDGNEQFDSEQPNEKNTLRGSPDPVFGVNWSSEDINVAPVTEI